MKWRYHQAGPHTHVRVYYKGALNGHLIFRNEEFEEIRRAHTEVDIVRGPLPSGVTIEFLDDIIESKLEPER